MDIWVILSFCILIHGSRNILVNIFSGVGYKPRARFMSDNNMNMFKFSTVSVLQSSYTSLDIQQ